MEVVGRKVFLIYKILIFEDKRSAFMLVARSVYYTALKNIIHVNFSFIIKFSQGSGFQCMSSPLSSPSTPSANPFVVLLHNAKFFHLRSNAS